MPSPCARSSRPGSGHGCARRSPTTGLDRVAAGASHRRLVAFPVAAHREAHPREMGAVEGPSGAQVQVHLDESAVLGQAHVAPETQGPTALMLPDLHAPLGQAPHDPIGDQSPGGSEQGDPVVSAEVVDQHGAGGGARVLALSAHGLGVEHLFGARTGAGNLESRMVQPPILVRRTSPPPFCGPGHRRHGPPARRSRPLGWT